MNPAKCAFGVLAGNFIGFLVHQKGIEKDKNKVKTVLEVIPRVNKKELQSLIGKINFMRRYIANSIGKMKAFSPFLRLNQVKEFIWGNEQQRAFNQIKQSLTTPPVLVPPALGRPIKLYI